MKFLSNIITEGKTGPLKKLDMLTIMVTYQMWKEYKLNNEFFGQLSEEELKDYDNLNKLLEQLDDNNSRVQWSFIKQYNGIISKTCDYVLSCPDSEFSKSDKRIWKEIKTHID